jgi:predicted MPP superfamily phosphohydrolase
MTEKEILLLDLSEIKEEDKIKKNIDLLIEINDIKREIEHDIIKYDNILKLYIKLRKYYIFEIENIKQIINQNKLKIILEKEIKEQNYNNIFQILNVISYDLIKDVTFKKLLKETKNKEYIYLLKDYKFKKEREKTKQEKRKEKQLKNK